jgi:glucose-6-phosphate 1-dehydrogenase|tara:strand:+ start:1436 stop:1738 length:303 start_codon:yes stop_codon:yes gene_type:complete
MNDNKLIAEFMGMTTTEIDKSMMIFKTIQGNEVVYIDELEYHTSWDWLMPVIENCKSIHPLTKVMKEMITDIDDSITECWGIESTHFRVVEFIKTYNDER